MVVSARDFFDQAIKCSEGSSEIEHRSAVNRAYYAAFHVAKDNEGLCNSVPDPSKRGSHESMISRYMSERNPDAKGAAYVLEAMKKKRVVADYGLAAAVSSDDARLQVAEASRVVAKICRFAKVDNPLADTAASVAPLE